MLLITEALLLISAVLGQDHRTAVKGQIYPLDMALNSVDDQYDGCRGEMADEVEYKYLKNELKKYSVFKEAWEKGEKFAKKLNHELTANHLIAIYVYSDALVFDEFNPATRRGKNEYEQNTYKWYSLYFLLTDAIQILKEQNKCYSTYRGTTAEFDKNVRGEEVRFGSFSSSSLKRKIAQRFGSKSCFEIKTCEGADLTKYSKLPREKEVLIPPYEKFKVTAVKTREKEKNLWCETVYKLESSGTKSDLNCVLSNKPSKTIAKHFQKQSEQSVFNLIM